MTRNIKDYISNKNIYFMKDIYQKERDPIYHDVQDRQQQGNYRERAVLHEAQQNIKAHPTPYIRGTVSAEGMQEEIFLRKHSTRLE